MVNMAADRRATSAGPVSSGGSAKQSVMTTAPTKPSRPASATVHALAVAAMPMTQANIDTPQQTNGQMRRSSQPAIASSTNDAGNWPKLRAVSAGAIRSGRPASLR